MRIQPVVIGLAVLAISLVSLHADSRDGEIVRGRNFEGVILRRR
jgi:hypothetical protein